MMVSLTPVALFRVTLVEDSLKHLEALIAIKTCPATVFRESNFGPATIYLTDSYIVCIVDITCLKKILIYTDKYVHAHMCMYTYAHIRVFV